MVCLLALGPTRPRPRSPVWQEGSGLKRRVRVTQRLKPHTHTNNNTPP